MAKRIRPPKTGKHETQSLLTGNKDTKFYSQDKLAPNEEKGKDPITQQYPLEPKLLGRGAAGANAQAKENPKRSEWKTEGWDINREAKKLAQKAAPKDIRNTGNQTQSVNNPSFLQSHGEQSSMARGGHEARRSKLKDPLGDPRSVGETVREAKLNPQGEHRKDKPEFHLRWRKEQGYKKSDFDDLVNAINLNIMNSYTKFRNKKDLDFSAFDKKPEEHPSGKKTKLDPKDTPSNIPAGIDTGRSQGRELGSDSKGQLRALRGGKGKKPATGNVIADPSILTSRRGGETKPTKVTSQYKNPKTGLMETEEQVLNLTPSKERKRGKEVKDPSSKKPEKPKTVNPYRQDEKGKYVRGTGYDKKITGARTQRDEKRSEREALPLTRYNRRHEGKLQHGKGFKAEATGDITRKKERIRGGREEDAMGIETTDPLAPHKHVREQDKEGKVVRNRLSPDPSNVKYRKGGRHKDPKDAERAVRQGMQNLNGTKKTYKGMISLKKLKANLDELMKKIERSPITAENYETSGGLGTRVPAKETFGDKRWRVPQIKNPKDEKQQAESKRRADVSRDQWVKDFAMNYIGDTDRKEREAKEWQKKKMALLKAFLSPITFKYKWGHTYERGQTKNVETQDHSRTGNTNNNQTYKKDKDDLTIKSLDEIYNAWKNGKKE